jgi:hypothetical protein
VKPTSRQVYKVDSKAPRMKKGSFSMQIMTESTWREFKKKFPEYKKKSWKEFSEEWADITETIREQAVTNPLGVKLGSYTGEIKLQYLPYKFEAIDYLTSQERGEKTKFLNLSTRGKVAVVKWERRWAVKFNKILQYFRFTETRDINNRAKKYIDSNPEKLRVARNTLGGYSVWRQIK